MAYRDDPERAPLLPDLDYSEDNVHYQFCQLVGVPPSDLAQGQKWRAPDRSLYARAVGQRKRQSCTYQMTASISNMLLLSQVVLGAAVTGLGASGSSHNAITLLGAANTIIAGLVAYLKSRGQPMRARMFRDDLERVVDEIENSEIMWLGISKNVHGYDDIDIEDQVTVRSEVARLTRLYDKAVRNNTLNNPDMYGTGDPSGFMQAALKSRGLPPAAPAAAVPPAPPATGTEASPAAAPTATKTTDPPAADAAGGANSGGEATAPSQTPVVAPVAADPDESPATAKPTVPSAIKVVASPVKDDKVTSGDGNDDAKDSKGKEANSDASDGASEKDNDDDDDDDESGDDDNDNESNKHKDSSPAQRPGPSKQIGSSSSGDEESDDDEEVQPVTKHTKGLRGGRS